MRKIDLETQWIEQFNLDSQDLDIHMSDGTMPSPNEYIAAGIDPDKYLLWYQVGGFDIGRMLELENAGIDISSTEQSTSEGCGSYQASIAYKYCNRDLDLDSIKNIQSQNL